MIRRIAIAALLVLLLAVLFVFDPPTLNGVCSESTPLPWLKCQP
jgi:hypothetical protein